MKKITIIILMVGLCLLIGVNARAQIELEGNYELSFSSPGNSIGITIPTKQTLTDSPVSSDKTSSPDVRVDPMVIAGNHLIKFTEEYHKSFPKGPEYGTKFTLSKDGGKIVIHCLLPNSNIIQTAKNKGTLSLEGCIIPYYHIETAKSL